MRKLISTNEAKVDSKGKELKKACITAEKQLEQLNKLSRKIKTYKDDVEFGDYDSSKIGKLNDFNLVLEELINMLSKM